MHSSPRNASDDEMFPDEALPNNPVVDLAGDSELSPPNSQTQTRETLGVNSNGKRPLPPGMTSSGPTNPSALDSHQDAETGYQWSIQEDQPGFAWKNTRAREEEARALDSIVDKSHMIKRAFCVPSMLDSLLTRASTIRRSDGRDRGGEDEALKEGIRILPRETETEIRNITIARLHGHDRRTIALRCISNARCAISRSIISP